MNRKNFVSRYNIPVIAGRKNRKTKIIYDKKIYQIRRNIEIFFGKIKENKRVVMRFDKPNESFLGFLAMASIKILLKLKIS
ncbi:MAG: transposase [Rickettsiales bacterium]|nr:transposase [Rickettsiales bacterium]